MRAGRAHDVDCGIVMPLSKRRHVTAIQNGDTPRLVRLFWEAGYPLGDSWFLMQLPPPQQGLVCGCSTIVLASEEVLDAAELSWNPQSFDVAGREAFAVRNMGRFFAAPVHAPVVDQSATIVAAKRPGFAPAIWAFLETDDFRASGSGILKYNPEIFPKESIKIAFDISIKLKTQSLAFDFIYDKTGKPLITEISYTYVMGSSYDNCPGYWDRELNWHEDYVDPQRYIIEDFISSIKNKHF